MPKVHVVLAKRLTWLFQNVRRPNRRRRYSSEEVATAVGVSSGYIRKLRTGLADNPTLNLIENLADFFGVDISFFFEHPEADPQTLYLAKKNNGDPLLESIAFRISALGSTDRTLVDEMLKAIAKIRSETEVEE